VIRLQKPKFAYFAGAIRPWDEALFHMSSEAVLRGLNVFEGIKGYWQPNGSFGLIALRRHWARLRRSAKLLHIPFEMGFDEFEAACHQLVQSLYEPERDMWVRATLYVIEGHWGEGTRADLVLTAYHQAKDQHAPFDLGISTWRRAPDDALPCRIKTSTNYQVARMAKIEGRPRGFDEMVLLNQAGRVAEATGCCIAIVRDGRVFTPPTWEGALESITVDIVERLCLSLAIPFERRPVERSELMIADEIALMGTLAEVTLAKSIDGQPLGPSPIMSAVAQRYRDAVSGRQPHPAVDISKHPRVERAVALDAAD
jgi:branched-chain amino acid aminotransferase